MFCSRGILCYIFVRKVLCIPFIILSFVIAGIADLSQGAGKLLGITTAIAYGSTITAGMLAYFVSTTIFPTILGSELSSNIGDPGAGMLSSLINIPLEPMFDVSWNGFFLPIAPAIQNITHK